MKRKRSMAGVFFSMFLRTVVIILFFVIIAMGFLLYREIRQAKKNKAATEARNSSGPGMVVEEDQVDDLLTAEPSAKTSTEEGGTQSDEPYYGLSLAVLNGTYTGGLAGAWRDKLAEAGYTNIQVGNYNISLDQTVVYIVDENVTTGLGNIFPNAIFNYGTIGTSDTDLDLTGVQAILIIGSSDDIVNGGD